MPSCSVKTCKNWNKNTRKKNISYHQFPKDEHFKKLWVNACGAKNININNARICSMHFSDECFADVPIELVNSGIRYSKRLTKTAIPTKYLSITLNTPSNSDMVENSTVDLNETWKLPEHSVDSLLEEKIENTFHDTHSNNNLNFINNHIENNLNRKANALTEYDTNQSVLKEKNLNTACNNKKRTTSSNNTVENSENIRTKTLKVPQNTLNHKEQSELHERCAYFVQENKKLRLEIRNLNKKLRLQEKSFKNEIPNKIQEILSPIFTCGQIKKLLHPHQKKVKWTGEDIASAISLRSVSPKGYRYLRKKSFPLPGFSTLRKWAAKIDMSEGVLHEILKLMEQNSQNLSNICRLCILSFDEVHISQNIEIDKKSEKTIGPHKTCQLGMIRGLFNRWKQPIFYAYDQKLTENILHDVIGKLYDVGHIVVATTTDLGPTNSGLWNKLNIGIEIGQNCWFLHPRNAELRIFVFNDPPHLLKLVRNNFIDSGFYYDNLLLTKKCLEEIIMYNRRDLKIAFKLEQKHLDAQGAERQRVSLAAQVFSNTTAKAVEWFGLNGFLKYHYWKECSEVFKLVNDWFDLFNSKKKFDKNTINAYGLDLELQNETLNKMTTFMKNMRVGSRKSLLPFQKGIVLNNESLKQLFIFLREKHSSDNFTIEYILTNRINQDVIENFFSYIRAMGAGHDKPSALQFKYRLKWFILGKHSRDMFVSTSNTEEDMDETLFNANEFNSTSCQLLMTELLDLPDDQERQDFLNETEVTYEYDGNDEDELDMVKMDETEIIEEIVNVEALTYISGYVAHRFRSQYPFLGNPTHEIHLANPPFWISHMSRGNLIFPSQDLSNAARIMEKVFNTFHGNSLAKENLIFTKVTEIVTNKLNATNISIPTQAILCLVRTRTYIRLRELNKKRKESYENIRRVNRIAKTQKFFN